MRASPTAKPYSGTQAGPPSARHPQAAIYLPRPVPAVETTASAGGTEQAPGPPGSGGGAHRGPAPVGGHLRPRDPS